MPDTAVLDRGCERSLANYDAFFTDINAGIAAEKITNPLGKVRYTANRYKQWYQDPEFQKDRLGDPHNKHLLYHHRGGSPTGPIDSPTGPIDNDGMIAARMVAEFGLPDTAEVHSVLRLMAKELDDRLADSATREEIEAVINKNMVYLAIVTAQAT